MPRSSILHRAAPAVALTALLLGGCSGGGERVTGATGITTTPVSVRLDFSGCTTAQRPLWVAFQDGTGAWTQVTGSGEVYTASLTSAQGGVAIVSGAPPYAISLLYRTRAEFAEPAIWCPAANNPVTKSISGMLVGIESAHQAEVSMGGDYARPFGPGEVTLRVLGGPQDLVAFRTSYNPPYHQADRLVIRRDLNISEGGSFGTVDFNGAQAAAPVSAVITVSGILATDRVQHSSFLSFGSACVGWAGLDSDIQLGSIATFNVYGIPSTLQRPSDLHTLEVSAGRGVAARGVSEQYHDLQNRAVVLPAPLSAPTFSTLGGSYPRVQAALPLGSEFQFVDIIFQQSDRSTVSVSASTAALGGGTVAVSLPDFAGVAGWNSAWAPVSSQNTGWVAWATGTNRSTGHECFDGAYTRQSLLGSASFAEQRARATSLQSMRGDRLLGLLATSPR